jgi:hypothetical protein
MIAANFATIIANLALDRSVNYNRKVCCKLKRTFMIVNYDPKPLIVQATGKRDTNINDPFCVASAMEAKVSASVVTISSVFCSYHVTILNR